MKYTKEDFEEMVANWQFDGAPEFDDLKIIEITEENGNFKAIAEDEKCTYSLTDDGAKNIVINYLGTK